MKRLLVLALVCLPVELAAQDAQNYVMYEAQYLTPAPGKMAEFSAAMAAHNKKFHASGPFQANVWSILTGPYSGQYSWVMGPCTFTDLDSRPSGADHESDWAKVVSFTVPMGEEYGEYWRLDADSSYMPDNKIHPILRIRFYDIQRNEGYRFNRLLEQIKEVYQKKQYPVQFRVFRNRFFSGSAGRDVATVATFDKWADLDRDVSFSDDFEEVHGKGSWRLFMDEISDVVVSAQDELRELMPDLGGGGASSTDD